MTDAKLTWGDYLSYRARAQAAEAEVERLRTAVNEAAYALNPNQGESPDATLARMWLYTAFRKDHPNYVDPSTLTDAAKEPQ